MDIRKESLKKHYEWKGKIAMQATVKADTAEALALAYTPGVAEPCLAIKEDVSKSFELKAKLKISFIKKLIFFDVRKHPERTASLIKIIVVCKKVCKVGFQSFSCFIGKVKYINIICVECASVQLCNFNNIRNRYVLEFTGLQKLYKSLFYFLL